MQVLFPAAVIVLVPVPVPVPVIFLKFYFIRSANYCQGHRNSMTPITAGRNSPSPHERQTTTAGTTSPTLYERCVDSLTSHKIYICKGCETGPTVFRSYPRRLESITVYRYLYKAALSPQLFKDPECWSGRDLNQRPPARQTGAYPTELTRRRAKAN